MINTSKKISYYFLLLFSFVTALGPFNPLVSYSGSDYDGNESSPVTIAIQGTFILWLLFSDKISKKIKNFATPLWIFYIIFLLSSIFNISVFNELSILYFIKILLCIILYCKLPNLFINIPNSLPKSLLIFSLTSAFICLLFSFGFLDAFTYWSKGRAYIFFENPNSSSSRFCLAFLAIIYIVFENPLKWKKKRYILLSLLLPILYAIMASGSRGSFLILLGAILLYTIIFRNLNHLKKLGIVLGLFSAMIFSILIIAQKNTDFSIIQRLKTASERGDIGRTKLIEDTKSISNDYPIFGAGAVVYREEMKRRFNESRVVHNLYWYVVVTTGCTGAFFFLWFISGLSITSFRAIKKEPFSFVILVTALTLSSKTGGILGFITLWYMFSISVYLANKNENYYYLKSK